MTRIREGNVEWTFESGWSAEKFDDWAFYRKQFQTCADHNKAMDILALPPNGEVLWMIEAKDYRRHRRDPSKGPLPMEIAKKARDTLAGILAASANAVDNEQRFARKAAQAKKIRVVLHLEQATKPSKLFPWTVDPADVKQEMKRLLKAVDPRAAVMSTATRWDIWTTTWSPNPAADSATP